MNQIIHCCGFFSYRKVFSSVSRIAKNLQMFKGGAINYMKKWNCKLPRRSIFLSLIWRIEGSRSSGSSVQDCTVKRR